MNQSNMMEENLSYSSGIQPHSPIQGLFMLIRPVESIFVGLALLIAHFMANPPLASIDVITLIFIFIAGYFISAQGMVHNDIIDLDIDRINAPHRTLPSGVISTKIAWLYVGFLASVSVLFAIFIDVRTQRFPFSTLYALVFILLIDGYNYYFKKKGIIGNIIIGFAVTNLFLYSDLFVNYEKSPPFTVIPVTIGFVALFINIGREIIKAMSDVEGDAEKGVNSIAAALGMRRAGKLGSLFILIGMGISLTILVLPVLRQQFALISLLLLVVVNGLMFGLLLKLWQSFTPKNAFWVKERIFYVMMLYLAPFLVQVIINYTAVAIA